MPSRAVMYTALNARRIPLVRLCARGLDKSSRSRFGAREDRRHARKDASAYREIVSARFARRDRLRDGW